MKKIIIGLIGVMLFEGVAAGATCPTFPYALTNGATADASQVMGNFNILMNCVNAFPSGLNVSGNVGIGTSAPWASLTVVSANGALALDGTGGNTTGWIGFYDVGGAPAWTLFAYHPDGDFYLQNNGATTNMRVASGTNSWAAVSDIRPKKNIKTLSVLERLDGYRGVSFDWRQTGKHDIGVVAQELYEIFPEVVNKGSDGDLSGPADTGTWSVQYDRLGALALEAAKELKAENNNLRARIRTLEAVNNNYASRLERLEQAVGTLQIKDRTGRRSLERAQVNEIRTEQ